MHTAPANTIADIVIPDTPLVRDVTALIRDTEDDLLFHHSRRVFLFGALQGRRRGLQPDLELLYVGAISRGIRAHRGLPHLAAALRGRRGQRGPRLSAAARRR